MVGTNWETPPEDFRYLLFERVDRAENMARYYLPGWQPTLDKGESSGSMAEKEGFSVCWFHSPLTRWMRPGHYYVR